MLDRSSPEGQITAAAMRLAEQHDWDDISLAAIAREANIPLHALRKHFSGKTKILRAFVRAVDDEVLERASGQPSADDSPRDRLFDVLMTRFEVLEPYKAALKKIAGTGGFEPELIRPILNSQRWMLIAAGIPADGMAGIVRTTGLSTVYARAFRTWLKDDDAGHAKTMAALDRRLRRGERWLHGVSDTCRGLERLAASLVPGRRGGSDGGNGGNGGASDDEVTQSGNGMADGSNGFGGNGAPPDASPKTH